MSLLKISATGYGAGYFLLLYTHDGPHDTAEFHFRQAITQEPYLTEAHKKYVGQAYQNIKTCRRSG